MNTELIEHAKKCAKCIYIAADKVVADDISKTITDLIAEIRYLDEELKPPPIPKQKWWESVLHNPVIWGVSAAIVGEAFMRQLGPVLFFSGALLLLILENYRQHLKTNIANNK